MLGDNTSFGIQRSASAAIGDVRRATEPLRFAFPLREAVTTRLLELCTVTARAFCAKTRRAVRPRARLSSYRLRPERCRCAARPRVSCYCMAAAVRRDGLRMHGCGYAWV